MRKILLAIFFVLVPIMARAQENEFVRIAPQPDDYAWWLRAEFHAFGTEVRGIPVTKIRANWCKATEFRDDLFPPDLAKDLQGSDLSFAADGFFDGSKVKQVALVGVYQTCAGKRGAFFLILALPQNQTPAVRFVKEIPGEHEFVMLAVSADSTISVYQCMECDHLTKFRWNKSKRQFVQLPEEKSE